MMESPRRTPAVTTRSRSRLIESQVAKHEENDFNENMDRFERSEYPGRSLASRTALSPTKKQNHADDPDKFWLFFKLARPKFLIYSLAMHSTGVLIAAHQSPGRGIDFVLFALLQMTIWSTHIMTHFINEYGDYEVDKLNANAGSWTGGSKVLREGLLSRNVALNAGAVSLVLSFFLGTACVLRFVGSMSGDASISLILSDPLLFAKSIPWSFVLLGFSVFAVAIAYSVEPFKLSSHALGELCVSYVLTFVTPSVGILSQGGYLDWQVVYTLLPLFIVNANRMVVMNIPDREGDAQGQKNTSVVLLGEERAVILHNIVTLVTYFLVIPFLPLSHTVRVAYYSVLPIRWWQSLRLNSPAWWRRRDLTDSIPFVESMYVLSTGIALCIGLFVSL